VGAYQALDKLVVEDDKDQAWHQDHHGHQHPDHQRRVCLVGGVEGHRQARRGEGVRTRAEHSREREPLGAQQVVELAAVDLLAQPARERDRVGAGVGRRPHFEAQVERQGTARPGRFDGHVLLVGRHRSRDAPRQTRCEPRGIHRDAPRRLERQDAPHRGVRAVAAPALCARSAAPAAPRAQRQGAHQDRHTRDTPQHTPRRQARGARVAVWPALRAAPAPARAPRGAGGVAAWRAVGGVVRAHAAALGVVRQSHRWPSNRGDHFTTGSRAPPSASLPPQL